MKKIWIEDIVEFDGKFYKIPKSKIGPKPIQNRIQKFCWEVFLQKRLNVW